MSSTIETTTGESRPATPPRHEPPREHARHEHRPDHPIHPETAPSRHTVGSVPWQQKAIMLTAVVVPFLGCIAAIAWMWQYGWMGWLYLGMMIGGWMLTGLGITIGFHRLLSHRAFDTYRGIRAFWMAMGALAIEGSPLAWCATHRKHHRFSDQHGDPHSPHLHGQGWKNQVKGFIHAHSGWLFTDHWSRPEMQQYIPDLVSDKLLVAVDRMYYLWVAASLALPAAIGGLVTMTWQGALLGFLWGGLVRIFVTHHITWSINSVCHVFGSREYDSGDDSRNNFLFGLLGHGEGWHNNHHAFPTSARHGLRWWQWDTSWAIIRGMQALGLAWNVRLPSDRIKEVKRLPVS